VAKLESSAKQAADAATAAAKSATVAAAISNAAAKGVANTAMDMEESINCGCVMGRTTGEYSTANGVENAVNAMANAEIRSEGSASAVALAGRFGDSANFQSRTTAMPATDVNAALSAAMSRYAQSRQTQNSLMSTTPMAQQTAQLSTNLSNVNTSPTSMTGVTPSQSFSTTNKSVDATSFSLGSFTPGQSSNPTAPTPNSSMSNGLLVRSAT